ncbi:MAG TPA: HlyD family efflux transporter periplasmic adaptor subunit [Myxococcales bacterium]|jgi:multidrug efflux pump subunit AcrA (membrane-fusion protein)
MLNRGERAMFLALGTPVVCALAGLALFGRKAAVAPAVSGAPKKAAAPRLPNDREEEAYVGVLFSKAAADVPARIDGIVRDLLVAPGDAIAAGGPLAVLEARHVVHDLREAEGALVVSKAENDAAAIDLRESKERLSRLLALGDLISPAEGASARAQVGTARARGAATSARMRALQETVRIARSAALDQVLRAPFDCVVSAVYSMPGATAKAGDPLLRVVGRHDLWLRFAVMIDDAEGLGSYASRSPLQPGATVVIELPGAQSSLTATVMHVPPELDEATHSLFVEARLDVRGAPGAGWVAGRRVRVRPSQRAGAAAMGSFANTTGGGNE